jgi:hypothetical protein
MAMPRRVDLLKDYCAAALQNASTIHDRENFLIILNLWDGLRRSVSLSEGRCSGS